MTGFDWPALMRAGMHGLGLAPAAFWQLTPVELAMLMGRSTSDRPLDRQSLEALARSFPDETEISR